MSSTPAASTQHSSHTPKFMARLDRCVTVGSALLTAIAIRKCVDHHPRPAANHDSSCHTPEIARLKVGQPAGREARSRTDGT
ncbi:MAG: hypothetical protein HC828_21995 [Blastochloris sp.]|nr:hypothetical protein [Blastochloris sp.]